ncbi:ankyrin repeat-containing domain protein [Fusarium venenatum]|uniref:ankyrin repeat-containing domain protein n=1 Tax=Fusarium venenatum TaxID=56646 RepID=UPI001DB143DD|nr:ankyrin repeat-containing domain protein [Fusarium venenatum]
MATQNVDEKGGNVACIAALAGATEVLEELIKWSDIEFDPTTGVEGVSTLEAALKAQSEEAALILIPYSDANPVYSCGDRPLNLAAKVKSIESVRLLFSQNISVNARGIHGHTALHNAAVMRNEDMIDLILSHPDIDISICDNDGNTPLMAFLQCPLGMKRVTLRSSKMFLSSSELDINAQNPSGDTALLIAASMEGRYYPEEDEDIFMAFLKSCRCTQRAQKQAWSNNPNHCYSGRLTEGSNHCGGNASVISIQRGRR